MTCISYLIPHFRIEALRRVGFWDAYNVTEDADLGLRLARAGFSMETFASQTYEEAPTSLNALLHQRTRWLKGWMRLGIKSIECIKNNTICHTTVPA